MILIPYDFTAEGDVALDHGCRLAANFRYPVCILHVINRDSRNLQKKEELSSEELKGKINKKIQAYCGDCKLDYEIILKEGSIFYTINELAEKKGAKLVVMATHGKKGIQYLTGSNILKIITDSKIPQIVVQKKAFGSGYKDIIFPINNFSEVDQKLKWAKHIAKSFNSVIHLFKIPQEEFSDETEKNLKIIREAFHESGIKFQEEFAIKHKNFADQVIEYAQKNESDLIVIMTNPDEIRPAFILGPWDEKIIFNEACIPVLCINPASVDVNVVLPLYW